MALSFVALSGCRRDEQRAVPIVSASVSAAVQSHAQGARAANFSAESKRAAARWSEKPTLGECAAILHEKADIELCQAASSAVRALEEQPATTPERVLPVLESSALALVRLSERARFLSFSELSDKRIAGAASAPATSAAPTSSRAGRAPGHPAATSKPDLEHHGTFQLESGPVARLLATSLRLEHDVLRNLGAYLEYAELPVRRAAFEAVKRLYAQHQPWASLAQLMREASLLESDSSLKGELRALALRAQPPLGLAPDHSDGSK